MANHYEVFVGNVGSVYSGESLDLALQKFKAYRDQSRDDVGRAAGEDVTVLKNGNIRWEYSGEAKRLL